MGYPEWMTLLGGRGRGINALRAWDLKVTLDQDHGEGPAGREGFPEREPEATGGPRRCDKVSAADSVADLRPPQNLPARTPRAAAAA